MMGLFQKSSDPIRALERDLEAKLSQREALSKRLAAAEPLIAKKRAAAEKIAMNGADDQELDRAEADARAAEDRVQTLRGGLVQFDQAISSAEQELATAVDKKQRGETADAIDRMIADIERALPPYSAAMQALEATFKPTIRIIPAVGRLMNFLQGTRAELANAVSVINRDLRARAVATREGHGPADLPRIQAPALVEPTRAKIETRRVFSLEALRWTEHGEHRVSAKYAQVDLPVALLPRALAAHLVDEFDSERTRRLIAAYGQSTATPSLDDAGLVDLDAMAVHQAEDVR
jgi:hypothetical protein